ncbi:DUF2501 domain-containing protein [Novosphingobium sp. G106]|uniref:DUF2501 domain-containing protein n=1 Tax=Novosphingobium sp. G106 TaxID=2849500 RepID=UPI001C2D5543|nr:DUF2501 domain-containing protein [Novosphingobium sp. G106]MBV1686969.1 DUF2501 domain-containing protein [Novosphingobium sp. G106]
MKCLAPIFPLAVLFAASNATAQLPSIPGMGGIGGLPDISSIGVGNATGVLGYCLKNKFLKGNEASSVLNTLSGKPNVRTSPGYADGQSGNLKLGNGSNFSLSGIQGQAKTQACNMVLKQAKTFL